MPDVREVFDLVTEKVRPDPGALDRQHRDQRRRVTTRKTGVFAIVAVLTVAGLVIGFRMWIGARTSSVTDGSVPSIEGRAPTIERLTGVWAEDEGSRPGEFPFVAWFSADGSFAFESDGEFESPAVAGTYEIAGDVVTFHVGGEVCQSGDILEWRARVTDDGRLNAVLIRDAPGESCGLAVGTPMSFTRVSPVSPASLAIATGKPGPDAGHLSSASQLAGVWLGRDTGDLISFNWYGTYRRDGSGLIGTDPNDEGTYRIEDGSVAFTSGEGSVGCAAGDVTVWTRVRLDEGALRAFVEAADDCGREAGVVEIWVRVFDPLVS
jgi:hypothetical protein